MKILFLTLLDFESFREENIYTDLLRMFMKSGHTVYAISPVELRKKKRTCVIQEENNKILKLRIGNTQKTNLIEKGISVVTVEYLIIDGIRKHYGNVRFDLVLYSTPPITFCRAAEYVKRRDNARTYLLLKDIFPQNAVDIGMLRKNGLIHRYFRMKEKKLYGISDTIGCLSPANVDYVLKHNQEVKIRDVKARISDEKGIVEVCPNCMEPADNSVTPEERRKIRAKYAIPQDKVAFIYGGNLGRPQGIDFMLKCLHSLRKNQDFYFWIVGNGTEYSRIEHYIKKYNPENILLHQWLPKEDYDKAMAACDVGLIFLDHRFTVPNFPSRLLGYMSAKLPVLAVTDTATDIGKVITENGFGWWCESNDVRGFNRLLARVKSADREKMGFAAFECLRKMYSVQGAYETIVGM